MINVERIYDSVVKYLGDSNKLIEELIENAIRAKANQINIKVSDDKRFISVMNNGQILKDFSPLLTLADTNYDAEVIANHQPAGMGVMMMLAASSKVLFASGFQRLEVDGQRFFTDTKYRESVLGTVETRNIFIDGFYTELHLLKPLQVAYDSRKHTLDGTLYYYGTEIYLDYHRVESKYIPLAKQEIEWVVSKDGSAILDGAIIGVEKRELKNTSFTKSEGGYLYWHGKKISVPGIRPFTIEVKDSFKALSPRLPDRTGVVNAHSEINEVKIELEKQLKPLIQNLIDEIGPTIKNRWEFSAFTSFIGKLELGYTTETFVRWTGGAFKDNTERFYTTGHSEAALTINGKPHDESVEDVRLMNFFDQPDEIAFGNVNVTGCEAPSWLKAIVVDKLPVISVTQPKQYAEASNSLNYNLQFVESITFDGYTMTSLWDYDDDVYYFTKEGDAEELIKYLFECSDYSDESKIRSEVKSDVDLILTAFKKESNLYDSLEYPSTILRSVFGVTLGDINIEKFEIDVENKMMKIINSGKEYLLPLK